MHTPADRNAIVVGLGCWLAGVAVYALLNDLIDGRIALQSVVGFASFLAAVMAVRVRRTLADRRR